MLFSDGIPSLPAFSLSYALGVFSALFDFNVKNAFGWSVISYVVFPAEAQFFPQFWHDYPAMPLTKLLTTCIFLTYKGFPETYEGLLIADQLLRPLENREMTEYWTTKQHSMPERVLAIIHMLVKYL